MLMLLNQVTNLENQLKTTNIAQNQTTGINSNLVAMMSQLKSLQGSKPNLKTQFKREPAFVNRNQNMGANLASLLASVNGEQVQERGRCVWVTGIPESYQEADKLLNIFGNFGNVQKIVFSSKKSDGALIQMDDPRCCVKSVAVMNNQKLDGQSIKVAFTKIDLAKIKEGDTKSMHVWKAKENWRFAKDSKFRRICMSKLRDLTASVIVSNIPEGKNDELKKHIIESGYTVKSMEGSQRPEDTEKPKPSTGYTMSMIELASIEEAIGAVAHLHNSWPKKFGTMKNDRFGNARGLVFSLAGKKQDKQDKKIRSDGRGRGGEMVTCYNCNKSGHMAKDCRGGSRAGGVQGRAMSCYNCNGEGHMARDCPEVDRRNR